MAEYMEVQKSEKRGCMQANEDSNPSKKIDENSSVVASFRGYQKVLDSRHDKYERLVKYGRDVTIASKRIIFLLQRAVGAGNLDKIFKEADEKFLGVQDLLKKIASELAGEDPFQFDRAFSPGVQEYIEALSFCHYLRHRTLISFEEVKEMCAFSKEGGRDLEFNPFDYILGIADLTGELMRLCINSAANGDRNTCFQVRNFLRQLHNTFLSLGNVYRDVSSKVRVMKASLSKVEAACYTLKVRGLEIPQFALAEVLSSEIIDHLME